MSDPIHDPGVGTETETVEATRPRLLPPYHVILENDDYHSFEFVVKVLCEALRYELEKSYQLTMEAHTKGQTAVWTGPKEVAELKLDQILTFHETRADGQKFGPLHCRLEPAE